MKDSAVERIGSELRRGQNIKAGDLATKIFEDAAQKWPDASKVVLSQREKEALSNLAHGLPRANAAFEMKIAEHTFRTYVDQARRKLRGKNTVHAVTLAAVHSLIKIDKDESEKPAVLSFRQAQTLYYLALGYNQKDASLIIGVSLHTFQTHLGLARNSVGKTNDALHAVAKVLGHHTP